MATTYMTGDKLPLHLQQEVLNSYIYRWTTGNRQRAHVYNCSKCDIKTPYENTVSANGHTHPTVPLISDEQWLKDHAFAVNKSGTKLDARYKAAVPARMAREMA